MKFTLKELKIIENYLSSDIDVTLRRNSKKRDLLHKVRKEINERKQIIDRVSGWRSGGYNQ